MTDTAALRAKLHDLAVAYQRAREDMDARLSKDKPEPDHNGTLMGLRMKEISLRVELIQALDHPAALVEIFAPGGDGWHLMHTAPYDGTEILVFCNDTYEVVFWQGGRWLVRWTHEDYGEGPTHWRPLPAPPALQENPDAR